MHGVIIDARMQGAQAPRDNLDFRDLVASKATRAAEGTKASMEVAAILV
jgi:hypothetical protein